MRREWWGVAAASVHQIQLRVEREVGFGKGGKNQVTFNQVSHL